MTKAEALEIADTVSVELENEMAAWIDDAFGFGVRDRLTFTDEQVRFIDQNHADGWHGFVRLTGI